jgi:hypothetical protein
MWINSYLNPVRCWQPISRLHSQLAGRVLSKIDGQKMSIKKSVRYCQLPVLAMLLPVKALADPEIMIHEYDLAERGEIVTTMHSNYTLRGARSTDDGTWPGYRHTFLMAEFATGLAPGWEVGVHIPVQRAGVNSDSSRAGQWGASGVMFRLKHVVKHDSGLFYGFNTEYDMLSKRFSPESRGIEMRGILGYDNEHYRVTLNPHVMILWGNGQERKNEFAFDMKALHKLQPDFAWGVEIYTDWGKLENLQPSHGDRTIYLLGEFNTRAGGIHLGIGKGFQQTADRLNVKAVWAIEF